MPRSNGHPPLRFLSRPNPCWLRFTPTPPRILNPPHAINRPTSGGGQKLSSSCLEPGPRSWLVGLAPRSTLASPYPSTVLACLVLVFPYCRPRSSMQQIARSSSRRCSTLLTMTALCSSAALYARMCTGGAQKEVFVCLHVMTVGCAPLGSLSLSLSRARTHVELWSDQNTIHSV